jgi:hypothetical protein
MRTTHTGANPNADKNGFNTSNAVPATPMGSSASASDTRTAKYNFTWHPDAANPTPPKSVVVKLIGTASAGVGGFSGSGTCSITGEGTLSPSESSNVTGTGQSVTSTYYVVKDSSGGSFSVTISGTASAMGTRATGYSNQGYVSASVGPLTVQVSSAKVSLTGTTVVNGQDNILIGQGCSANLGLVGGAKVKNESYGTPPFFNLSVTYSDIVPVNGATLDTAIGYSVKPDGQYFDNYLVTATYAKVVSCADYDATAGTGDRFTQPNPRRWIWKTPNTATITGSAKVVVPTMAAPVGTVTETKTVIVQEPTHTLNPTLANGVVRIYDWTQTNPFGKALGFWVNTYDPYLGLPGIRFKANVTTPAVFYNSTAGYGTVQYVQTFTPGRTYYKPDGTLVYAKHNGSECLDTQYPYPLNGNNLANGGDVKTNDSPGSLLQDTIVVIDYNKIIVDETLLMHLMYKPPASTVGNDWVTLDRVKWKWTANAEKIQNAAGQKVWQAGPVPVGDLSIEENMTYYEHPKWTLIY